MEIRSWTQLCQVVDELGFLPLLDSGLSGFSGFSVEAMTPPEFWIGRSDDNPWEWRYYAASSGRVVYGRFFEKNVIRVKAMVPHPCKLPARWL